MAEWKSNARFGQPAEEGTIFDFKGQAKISIHKIVGCGNSFYLTCRDLDISSISLNTDDFELAAENAKTLIRVRLEMIQGRFDEFLSDKSDTRIARY